MKPELAKKIPAGFISYLDPTEVDRPPSGGEWAHEIKWDGYRAQAHLSEGRATIYARNGTFDVIVGGLGVDRAHVDPFDQLYGVEKTF